MVCTMVRECVQHRSTDQSFIWSRLNAGRHGQTQKNVMKWLWLLLEDWADTVLQVPHLTLSQYLHQGTIFVRKSYEYRGLVGCSWWIFQCQEKVIHHLKVDYRTWIIPKLEKSWKNHANTHTYIYIYRREMNHPLRDKYDGPRRIQSTYCRLSMYS